MKKLVIGLIFTASISNMASAQATERPIRIEVSKVKPCEAYKGDLRKGKKFSLFLKEHQELVIQHNNKHNNKVKIKVPYVQGPKGRLKSHSEKNKIMFYSNATGNHFVMIKSNSAINNIKICAY